MKDKRTAVCRFLAINVVDALSPTRSANSAPVGPAIRIYLPNREIKRRTVAGNGNAGEMEEGPQCTDIASRDRSRRTVAPVTRD